MWLNRKICTGCKWLWGSKILGHVVPATCCRLISIQWPWWSQFQCCKFQFHFSSKDSLKCFLCLWQILNFSGQISGFLVILVYKNTVPLFFGNVKINYLSYIFQLHFKFCLATEIFMHILSKKIKNAPNFSRISVFHCQLSPLPYFCHNSFRVGFLWAAGGGKSELGYRHTDSHMYLYKSLCIYEKFGTNPISGVSESINLQILCFLGIQVLVCIASYILH